MNKIKYVTSKYLLHVILILGLGSTISNGQGIVIQKSDSQIQEVQADQIAKRVSNAITDAYPNLILELGMIEDRVEQMSGLDSKIVFRSILSFQVYNILDEQFLGSFDISIQGSADTKQKAAMSSLREIRRKKTKINDQLSKLNDVLKVDCTQVDQAIKRYESQERYGLALALAKTHGDCPNQSAALDRIYTAYQERNCNTYVTKAEALIAAREYRQAILTIMQASPKSRCSDDLQRINKLLDEKVTQEQQANWDIYKSYFTAISSQNMGPLINMISLRELRYD